MCLFDENGKLKPEKVIAVLFINKQEQMILWYKGYSIKQEIEDNGSYDIAEYVRGYAKNTVSQSLETGIWIWEGVAVLYNDWNEYHCSNNYYYEYETTLWRKPTEEEWESIKRNRKPFDAPEPVQEEYYGFGNKTIL